MIINKYHFLLGFTLLGTMPSCRDITDKDMIGTYASDNPERNGHPSRDTLVIMNNHQYFYKNFFGQFRGTWALDGSRVEFHNFGKDGMWPAKAEFHKDTVRIVYAAEEGIYYTRIKNQDEFKVPVDISPAKP